MANEKGADVWKGTHRSFETAVDLLDKLSERARCLIQNTSLVKYRKGASVHAGYRMVGMLFCSRHLRVYMLSEEGANNPYRCIRRTVPLSSPAF
jgi:hypothetical protein